MFFWQRDPNDTNTLSTQLRYNYQTLKNTEEDLVETIYTLTHRGKHEAPALQSNDLNDEDRAFNVYLNNHSYDYMNGETTHKVRIKGTLNESQHQSFIKQFSQKLGFPVTPHNEDDVGYSMICNCTQS